MSLQSIPDVLRFRWEAERISFGNLIAAEVKGDWHLRRKFPLWPYWKAAITLRTCEQRVCSISAVNLGSITPTNYESPKLVGVSEGEVELRDRIIRIISPTYARDSISALDLPAPVSRNLNSAIPVLWLTISYPSSTSYTSAGNALQNLSHQV